MEEELIFMRLLFSSSSTTIRQNYGLKRADIEKALRIKSDEEFTSFISRVNDVTGRYFKIVYDDKRDRAVVLMRVPARDAKSTLNKESLAILLYMFYQQDVLNHDFTLLDQLIGDFGHENYNATRKMAKNIEPLLSIGAVEKYAVSATEEAYKITTIGVHMFSDSFLRRTLEFSQDSQLSKDEMLKFFKRYNLFVKEDKS